MKLSILIPTLPGREHYLNNLLLNINVQKKNYNLEILIDDTDRQVSTGRKRNNLISRSIGDYIWFIDDDDDIHHDALRLVYGALDKKPDVVTFNGWMTTDGRRKERFIIRLGSNYTKRMGIYYRYPNHICPMKRELIKDIKFEDIYHGEDYLWATQIHDKALLQTEEVITEDIYHYKFRSKK